MFKTRRTVLMTTGCALTVALSTAAGIAAATTSTSRQLDASEQVYSQTLAKVDKGATKMAADLDAARTTLESKKDKVADAAVLVALNDVMAAAQSFVDQHTQAPDGAIEFTTFAQADAEVSMVNGQATRVQTLTQDLHEAVSVVNESHATWVLGEAVKRLDTARDALADIVREGDGVLAESDGKVADNAVRDALAAALKTAKQAAGADADRTDKAAVDTATNNIGDAKNAVDEAVAKVQDAKAVWEAEQAKVAAQKKRDAEEAAAKAVEKKHAAANGSIDAIVASEAKARGVSFCGWGARPSYGWVEPGANCFWLNKGRIMSGNPSEGKIRDIVRHEAAHLHIKWKTGDAYFIGGIGQSSAYPTDSAGVYHFERVTEAYAMRCGYMQSWANKKYAPTQQHRDAAAQIPGCF